MSSNSSKKFHITLPLAQGSEIETIATERGVPAAQIIRERLMTWQPPSEQPREPVLPTPHPDLTAFTTQLQQLTEQLHQVQQVVAQLSERPNATQPDPQIRAALQPVHTRLQQVETQVGVISNLVQQVVQQIIKHQLRLEGWLEAVYVILQPLLMDHQPEEVQQGRQAWIKELQQRLEQHLEIHK